MNELEAIIISQSQNVEFIHNPENFHPFELNLDVRYVTKKPSVATVFDHISAPCAFIFPQNCNTYFT